MSRAKSSAMKHISWTQRAQFLLFSTSVSISSSIAKKISVQPARKTMTQTVRWIVWRSWTLLRQEMLLATWYQQDWGKMQIQNHPAIGVYWKVCRSLAGHFKGSSTTTYIYSSWLNGTVILRHDDRKNAHIAAGPCPKKQNFTQCLTWGYIVLDKPNMFWSPRSVHNYWLAEIVRLTCMQSI